MEFPVFPWLVYKGFEVRGSFHILPVSAIENGKSACGIP